jgi:hypothetical protein
MKKIVILVMALFLCGGTAFAAGGIDVSLNNLNIQAKADLPGFTARVSTQFGIPVPQVQATLKACPTPADAFMVFQLGQMSQKPPEEVMKVYQKNKGQGWGTVAQGLGIKPGSAEFHALKRGDFALTGQPGGRGKGMGKDKGPGKDKEPGKAPGKGKGKGGK